jgi:RNA polymerase sigma-70 factor (ECF subfamily)
VGKAVHVLTIARELDTDSRVWADLAVLVGRAQRGDREAFGELVEQFQPTVYAIALRRLANASDALELTQEVFLHVLRRIGQLREPERFAGWLRQVAVRMAINRATRRVSPASVEAGILEGASEHSDEPLDQLISRERAERLWAALGRLKTLDREALPARDRRDARRAPRHRQASAAHGAEAAEARARGLGFRRPRVDRRPGRGLR